MRAPLWLLLLLCGSAVPAVAVVGVPDPNQSTIWCLQGDCQQAAQLMFCPCGNGDPSLSDVVFGVHLCDVMGDPIPFYPFQDIWLRDANLPGQLFVCYERTAADDNTDINGLTSVTIAEWPFGGWARTASLRIWVGGEAFGPTFFTLTANSPDINGDGAVDLADLGLLAADYDGQSDPSLWFRSDFNFDGTLNLSDVGKFALHYGHGCW